MRCCLCWCPSEIYSIMFMSQKIVSKNSLVPSFGTLKIRMEKPEAGSWAVPEKSSGLWTDVPGNRWPGLSSGFAWLWQSQQTSQTSKDRSMTANDLQREDRQVASLLHRRLARTSNRETLFFLQWILYHNEVMVAAVGGSFDTQAIK